MNLFGLSPGELLLIMMVAMIVIGPEKLPETAASIGKWVREFRRVTNELTQQFAEDNPFTEIQRALSFTDEPVAPAAPYVPLETTPAANNVPVVQSAAATVEPAPATVALPRRSDYFDRPSYYTAIDDAWTHGGLNGYAARYSNNGGAYLPPIDVEWTHGAAIAPPPVAVEPAAMDTESTLESAAAGRELAVDDQAREDVDVVTDSAADAVHSAEPAPDHGDQPADQPDAAAASIETAAIESEPHPAEDVIAEASATEGVDVDLASAPPERNGVTHQDASNGASSDLSSPPPPQMTDTNGQNPPQTVDSGSARRT